MPVTCYLCHLCVHSHHRLYVRALVRSPSSLHLLSLFSPPLSSVFLLALSRSFLADIRVAVDDNAFRLKAFASGASSSDDSAAAFGISLVQSPLTVAVGAQIATTLQNGANPRPPPSPPAPAMQYASLQPCNGTAPSQHWTLRDGYIHYGGDSRSNIGTRCLSLVKAAPYPAIVYSCEAEPTHSARNQTTPRNGSDEAHSAAPSNDELWEHTADGQLVMQGYHPSHGAWCLGYNALALGQNVRLEPCASGAARLGNAVGGADASQIWTVTSAGGLVNGGGAGCLSGADTPVPQHTPPLPLPLPLPPSAPSSTPVPIGVINYTRFYHRLGNRS